MPISRLTNQSIGIENIFDADPRVIEQVILSHSDETKMVEIAEAFLSHKLPDIDESIILINQIIDHIHADRDMTKVDQICEYFNTNKRTLQRLFNRYVGVSPKWVIRLYRLQNAAESMDYGLHHNSLELATELGYYDQSHFTKDFKSIIGKTPEAYLRMNA